MKLSIVVPVHNEGRYIEQLVLTFLSELNDHLSARIKEILLIENGSTDGSWEACQALEASRPELIRSHQIERGSYGEAIRQGMQRGSGTHSCILECDVLSVDFVGRCCQLIEEESTRFVVASKRHPESKDERSFKRRLLSTLYHKILSLRTGYPGTDTHGLKCIDTDLARVLCEVAQTTDELFQTEIVLLAWRFGIRVEEVPLEVREIRPTPVSIRRRLPLVIGSIRELKKSLQRFPPDDTESFPAIPMPEA